MTSPPSEAGHDLKEWARRYTEDLDLAVFPCRVNDKRPATEHGFKDATTDRDQIQEWWSRNPYNIGIPVPVGHVVLDVDSQDALNQLRAEDLELPATATAKTPRGWHFWFLGDGFRPSVDVFPGVDIRGPGSYVVVPPSTLPQGKEYRWQTLPENGNIAPAPEWLFDLVSEPEPSHNNNGNGSAGIQPAHVLQGVSQGSRDVTLFRYACRLRKLNYDKSEAETLILEAARNCDPPFPKKQALKKVESAWKYEPGKPLKDGRAVCLELGQEDPLEALQKLPESPPMDAVTSLLRALAATLEGKDRLDATAAREKALQALEGKVSAPARLVDAALQPGGGGSGPEKSGQSLILEPPEPWPEPVDGAELLTEIEATFTRFLSLPPGGSAALTLWAVFAHAHDSFEVSPLLALCSPEMRCGKSTAMKLLGAIVPKPIPCSNITPAALFRSVEKFEATLLVDEADSFLKNREELRGILNSGHTRQGAFVIRTAGEDHEPRIYRTWAPKAVALIGKLPSTLEDRSILIPMQRKMPGESVDRLRIDRLETATGSLRRKAARWVEDHRDVFQAADPCTPPELHDRAADNWRPLLALADLAGDPWPEKARKAAQVLALSQAGADTTMGVELLSDIREAFRQEEQDKVFTDRLLHMLHDREDRPWAEFGKREQPLSKNRLARLLKPYGVRPRQVRIGQDSRKGYRLEDFADAFARYLPPPEPKQAKQTNGDGALHDSSNRNTEESVSVAEPAQTPVMTGVVSAVSVADQGELEWEDL